MSEQRAVVRETNVPAHPVSRAGAAKRKRTPERNDTFIQVLSGTARSLRLSSCYERVTPRRTCILQAHVRDCVSESVLCPLGSVEALYLVSMTPVQPC